MPVNSNDRNGRKKKINYSSSFRGQQADAARDSFRREDELRHSTGSAKGHYVVNNRANANINMKYSAGVDASHVYRTDGGVVNGQRSGSYDAQMSDMDEPNTPSHSVSHLIKGFESKSGASSRSESSRLLTPGFGSYEDNSEYEASEKQKRSASKRKLSIRKRGKNNNDHNVTILQKLGIAPFMGSENRNAKKALAHFDVQSVVFDIENAAVLKAIYADGGNRPRNISTGASAASMRSQNKNAESNDSGSKPLADSIADEGDGASNDLVENCPCFRNEIGGVESQEEDKMNKLFGKFRANMSGRTWASVNKNRTSSLEMLHTTDDALDPIFGGSFSNELDQKKDIAILESINDDSKIMQWDRPKKNEKRIFDFQHIDLGAMYYREFFVGKDHQNFLGIDEKYGPICISMVRENLEKMAVLGHPKEHTKNSSNKYQYRIVLRTTELQTFRGTVLEESIPSTTRHGSSRALPARDVLEFCFPELQVSCLKTAVPGPKVPEHLQKLDEQQLSLQYKVGLLYCKAGQKSEEDMYNNEHHGPAFDEFMDVIGEKVFLKGFEGYRAQLDNKNDSTGTYSLYTKFQNREIMFHVSTLLPWTPNNKQQLLRKRHIGNDIVTVIFQEPGAEPFTPKNIRSHFQHVFIVVRVENPNSSNTAYRVAVSRSQDVPEFGPPIPPQSTFRKNKAFRDFLLSKVINAENAAHKSEKFTAMAVRTRFEYLKDLATNFVTTQTIDSGGAKFSKFNPMSLGVKKREKIHPPCNPEVWCQASLVWSVKVDVENSVTSRFCFIAISTSYVALINKVTKDVVVSIPCKSVIGWRISGYSMRLFYNNGQGLNLTLVEDDGNEMTFIVNRLKAVTPGCQTQDMSLRRSANGQLGFHVYYEGLVAEVEPYGMAWQAGLRKGSRLLEISSRLVGKMSHDRMIQSLRKPGCIRVVVLPPLPDGQPRNYKSTRNLKRYSSMTSVYSERLPDSSDTSGSSSSQENLPIDLDTITSIRVGGQKMTTIEALIKQSTPHGNNRFNNHPGRPQGFILDSDQSLEFTEASSGEHVLSSSGASIDLTDIRKVNGKLGEISKDAAVPGQIEMTGDKKRRSPYAMDVASIEKTPDIIFDAASISSSGIDPELTELEKTITDTRKSIDAKFYRSLVQSSNLRKHSDQANRIARSSRSPIKEMGQIKESLPPFDESHITRSNAMNVGNEFVSSENLDPASQAAKNRAGDSQLSSSSKSSSAKGSSTSLSRMRSPPPYEEAITSLDRQRAKKAKDKTAETRNEKTVVETTDASQSNDSSPNEKPRVLLRNTSGEKHRHRYQVKSENLEDLLGSKKLSKELAKSDSRTLPYEYMGNRNKLMIARSESNIHSSCENSSVAQENEDRKPNIVHTRVRNVDDVIREKIHVRSESADQLSGFSALLQAQRRPASTEPRYREESRGDLPRNLSRKGSREEYVEGLPYSSHYNRKIRSQENLVAEIYNESNLDDTEGRTPFRETTLGSVTSTSDIFTHDDHNINDTFAKIDQAFGFTSYGDHQNSSQTVSKERRRRRSKYRQKVMSSKDPSESSDEASTCSSIGSVNTKRSATSGRPRIKSIERVKPKSQDSIEKKKSEAEESLEAAITDFHSTLFNLPDQRSSQVFSTSDQNKTPHLSKTLPSSINSNAAVKIDRIPIKEVGRVDPKAKTGLKDFAKVQISRRTISYPEGKSKGYLRSTSAQSSFDSPTHSVRETGGRVQELVGKFSQQLERKGSLDSAVSKRDSDRSRSRSEARISLLNSNSPWTRRGSQTVLKGSEANSIARRFERYRASHSENQKQDTAADETPVRKKISVTVRPKLDMESESDNTAASLAMAPNSPSWINACERGMTTLPGRGKRHQKEESKNVVSVPLSVRGLDLAPHRTEEFNNSSKEDLRLMLSVLSGELIKEKSMNEKLLEELELAKIEREQLLEQSKSAASQLRKFTSWFYDSVSHKDGPNFDEN